MSILYMLWNPSVDMSLKCHFSHSPGQDPVALEAMLVEAVCIPSVEIGLLIYIRNR